MYLVPFQPFFNTNIKILVFQSPLSMCPVCGYWFLIQAFHYVGIHLHTPLIYCGLPLYTSILMQRHNTGVGSDMGTPAKWAPPDPKSLVKQASPCPHFASDLHPLAIWGPLVTPTALHTIACPCAGNTWCSVCIDGR